MINMIKFKDGFQGKVDGKETANIDSHFREAAIMLNKAIIHLFCGIDNSLSEKLQTHNLQISSQLGQIETGQKQITYSLETLRNKVDDLCSLKNLLEQEGQSKRILTNQHYEEHVIQPIAKALAPITDMVEDARKTLRPSEDPSDDGCMDLVDAIYSQLKQFFTNFGVESISHKPNTRFNPKLMKPVKVVPTANIDLDGCVAESLLTGLMLNKERLLRPESVSLYKHKAVEEQNILTLNERMDVNVTGN